MVSRQEDFQKKWAKVVAKAWSDPAFKKKLLQNPEATLAHEGLPVPKGMHVEIHESTTKSFISTCPRGPKGNFRRRNC